MQAPQEQGRAAAQIAICPVPSMTQQPVSLPQLVVSLPWVASPSSPESPPGSSLDASDLARRTAQDVADSIPMWDVSIALDALSLLLWPPVPGDVPPGLLTLCTGVCAR